MKRCAALLLLAGCASEPVWVYVAPPGPRQPTPVTALAFSADGKILLSGDPEGVVRVWDVDSGRLLRTTGPIGASVARLAVAPDGSRTAVLSDRSEVAVLPLRDGIPTRRIDAGHVIRTAAFYLDASALVTAGEGRRVECWDLATGEARWMVDEGSFPVQQVLVSPDGATVACRTRGGKLTLRSAVDGTPFFSLPGILPPETPADFLPDSRLAVIGSVSLAWNPSTRQAEPLDPWTLNHLEWPRWMAPPGGVPDLQRQSTRERHLLLAALELTRQGRSPAALSRDGSRMAIGEEGGRILLFSGGTDGVKFAGLAGTATRLAVSPGGRYIAASGPFSRGIRVWRSDRVGNAQWVGTQAGASYRFAFTGAHELRAVAPGRRETWTLSEAAGELQAKPRDIVEGWPNRKVGLSPDGRHAAELDDQGGLLIFNPQEQVSLSLRLALGSHQVDDLLPASNGGSVVAVLTRTRRLIHATASGTLPVALHPLTSELNTVAVSPDGKHVLFPDNTGNLILFDLASLVPLRQIVSDDDRIRVAAFLSDGLRFVAGTERGRLLLFPRDGRPRPLPATHQGRVLALAISSDDLSLVSSGNDDAVIYQHLPP